ncbi:MAG: HD domain-containing protein [Bacteroidales bacterium]|nr:HD domain-containing protein [Bacteroidales bacterium]
MDKRKRKIINDPVYGFIPVTSSLLFDLLEHPWVQRLRRIRQLGLTYLVYPGANHTRFQHSLGASYLMGQALQSLQGKDVPVSAEETLSASVAILLHDIGHGPFSHALEETIIKGLSHEQLSLLFMEQLNQEFGGQLDDALKIFQGRYPRKFFNQLISGQLDMDRMDYLQRDSYFTGVSEGIIGLERIIKMLYVQEEELVVEEKGIYSLEKFVLARRLMYWQVYFHKTVVSAEQLLLKILARARQLAENREKLFVTPALHYFLYDRYPKKKVETLTARERKELLDRFSLLDDNDIITSAKVWSESSDPVLSNLCRRLVNRKLFHVEIQDHPFEEEKECRIRRKMMKDYGFSEAETAFFVFTNTISNFAYSPKDHQIKILRKDGSVQDITAVSEIMDQNIISRIVEKHILCYPKEYTNN